MEMKEIRHIIINFLKNIINIFKEFKNLPNAWLYIFLSIILTFVFLIFTFPYNALIRNKLQSIGDEIGRSAYIGNIDFSLINTTNIDNIAVVLENGSEMNFQNINIDIGILSFLLKNSLKGNVIINNVKYEKEKTSVDLVAKSDLKLSFDSLADYPDGNIKLELQNVITNGITIKGFDIPSVRFSSITADLNILKKKLNIDDFKFTGPDLKGNISGSISLAKFLKRSQLNLNVSLDSSSALLENYKILLSNWMDDSNNIQLVLRGTISNPRKDPGKRPSSNKETNSRLDLGADQDLELIED